MTLPELLAQLDQLGHHEKLQILDHLIEGLEHESLSESSVDESADEVHWDTSLARSQEALSRMADKARQSRDRGLNRELDPDRL
jgi:hypothetical protein